MRNAERRNGTGCPPRTRQERSAVYRTVSTTVQPAAVSAGVRADLLQPGSDDTRGHTRNRGRHVHGQDRRHHRGDAPRALPICSGAARVHPEDETGNCVRWACRPGRTSSSARWCACCWRRTTSRRSPPVRTGSDPDGAATPRCGRWPTPGPERRGSSRETSPTASAVLIIRNHDPDPGGEDPRQAVSAAGAQHAHGRIPGGLAVSRHVQRRAAGRCRVTRPVHDLPAQVGRLRRDGSHPAIHPRDVAHGQPRARRDPASTLAGPPTRQPGHGPGPAAADAPHPSQDPYDPGYRRLRYTRYADDHLLGFIGPKAEAEQIKDQLATFLRDELKLELNPDKTLVTHARTRAARYLGYEITTQHSDTRSPAADGRSTGRSRCACHWM